MDAKSIREACENVRKAFDEIGFVVALKRGEVVRLIGHRPRLDLYGLKSVFGALSREARPDDLAKIVAEVRSRCGEADFDIDATYAQWAARTGEGDSHSAENHRIRIDLADFRLDE